MKQIKAAQVLLFSGALCGFLSVAIGAFAAHGLKGYLSVQAMGWMHTGVQYQMFHSIMICLLAIACMRWPGIKILKVAAICMLVGIVLFSGSLYLMALTQVKQLGMITPLGGIGFLLGWFVIMLASLKHQELWNRNER